MGLLPHILGVELFCKSADARTLQKNHERRAATSPVWLTLPATPDLPTPTREGLAPLRGVQNFYAQFGKGPHIVLLHGGLANSNYWGHQVGRLLEYFTVTVMDTRGHGRSPLMSSDFSYSAFANDVVDLLDFLKIERASIVGWSDGAITGLQLAISHPDRLRGLFAFGANGNVNGVEVMGSQTPVFSQFARRTYKEYLALSPRPKDWPVLVSGLRVMWRVEPNFTSPQLSTVKLPVVIADGQFDEIIKHEETARLARDIPGAQLIIQANVSHFAMLQEPDKFSDLLIKFLLPIT